MSVQELNSPNLVVPQDLVEDFILQKVNFSTTSTSYVDATGMSFHVQASKDYFIEMILLFTTLSPGQGLQIGVNGPASPTLVAGMIEIAGGSGSPSAARQFTTYNESKNFGGVWFTGENIAYMNCIFRNGINEGTFQLRVSADTVDFGTIGINVGSSIAWRKLN